MEHEFILDPETGHYLVINWAGRYVVADGVFKEHELPLVLMLLEGWPSYVPSEKLVQAITGRPPVEIAEMVSHYDTVLQPLVEACQGHFQHIGIHIEQIHQHGYKLSRTDAWYEIEACSTR